MLLWDVIFAVDPSLEIALWVCVAMLIRIRNKCQYTLIQFTGLLTPHCSNTYRVH